MLALLFGRCSSQLVERLKQADLTATIVWHQLSLFSDKFSEEKQPAKRDRVRASSVEQ